MRSTSLIRRFLVMVPICLATIFVFYFTNALMDSSRDSRDFEHKCDCSKHDIPSKQDGHREIQDIPNKQDIPNRQDVPKIQDIPKKQVDLPNAGNNPNVDKIPEVPEQTDPACAPEPKDNPNVNPLSKFYSVWYDPPTQVAKRDKVTIVIWTELWDNQMRKVLPKGKGAKCLSMPNCIFSKFRNEIEEADAVLFEVSNLQKNYNASVLPKFRHPRQHWVWYHTECPGFPSINFETYRSVFNWTITYRADSDSSGAWGSLHRTYQRLKVEGVDPNKDYTKGKRKLAVWFISKCNTQANRVAYATELVKHMHVDVFGRCGKTVCAKWNVTCMPDIITQYKFYLAFENMKCKEYLTEKFWRNALANDVIPVVLGANRSDYERLAPPHSYIHVDDFKSPKELANYLMLLDKDKDQYNAYFKWKTHPPKDIPLEEGMWCNMCRELLNRCPTKRKLYTNLRGWFEGENKSMCDPMEDVKFQELQFENDRFKVASYA
ncbi:4-galactosyl-N-acetylglucosaminide 3-alpha-L-fucosyltransferase FUT5-like [Branchiostoma floridae]|uniref:Fucosyltransferase n=1 Tax=Branchiostoma floridae TaxID=7739 RepID=A0A9J7KV37_BRAFL|nr:4-galactosyl-N-acetylglucosaminide 3-alpha-L-fucosyltransferase FUT5-like [Branchiostoma floridae]